MLEEEAQTQKQQSQKGFQRKTEKVSGFGRNPGSGQPPASALEPSEEDGLYAENRINDPDILMSIEKYNLIMNYV